MALPVSPIINTHNSLYAAILKNKKTELFLMGLCTICRRIYSTNMDAMYTRGGED